MQKGAHNDQGEVAPHPIQIAMSSFAGAERRQKRKSKLTSMMSRKSINKKEADKIKQLMVREAVNLQVQAKVEGNADTAPADEAGREIASNAETKKFNPRGSAFGEANDDERSEQ